jgi:hypothetical protein
MPRYRSLPLMSYRGRHRAPDPRIVRARQVARAGGGATLVVVLGAALVLGASTGGTIASANGTVRHLQPARAVAHEMNALLMATSTPSVPPPPTGKPTAAMTAPADGASLTAGTATTLTAKLSDDLVTALQAGSGGSCYFAVGNDANTVVSGTLNVQAATCSGTWTYRYGGTFSVSAWVATPSQVTYAAPPISVAVIGSTNARCTGTASAPSTCVYHWVETYYKGSTRTIRVCAVDAGCLWQSAHTAWKQIAGKDYWVNSTGQTLPDGNLAEAYLCVGSSPANWSAYSTSHSFDSLTSQPETSAAPVTAGVCTN